LPQHEFGKKIKCNIVNTKETSIRSLRFALYYEKTIIYK